MSVFTIFRYFFCLHFPLYLIVLHKNYYKCSIYLCLQLFLMCANYSLNDCFANSLLLRQILCGITLKNPAGKRIATSPAGKRNKIMAYNLIIIALWRSVRLSDTF